MENDLPSDLVFASFFFVDIVGLSNPILSTETQRTKIMILNETIYNCETFLSYPDDDLYILPTGDGMLIGFKDGLEEPINLAQELHEKLEEYNLTCPSTEKIQIRIGCNAGHIFVVKDVKGKVNLWGPGAILARRVMDLGDENHILITSNMAEDLIELSEKYRKILHPINDFQIKHGEEILLYSVYNEKFGNPELPQKIQGHVYDESRFTAKIALCDKITFSIILKKENFLTHQRTYQISNHSKEPIYDFTIGIMTNSEHTIEQLGIDVFEDGSKAKISKIFSPTPLSKQILLKFSSPLLHNETKKIEVNYSSNELNKHFEHVFLNKCNNVELHFIFSSNSNKTQPLLYHIDNTNITKTIVEYSTTFIKGLSTEIKWNIPQGINKKDLIRLEW